MSRPEQQRVKAPAALGDCLDDPHFGTLFRELLVTAPFATVVVDDEGFIVLVNVQAERLFGYARDELTGRGVEMLVPERWHGKLPAHGGASSLGAHPIGAGLELHGVRKDGREFPIEVGLSAVETPEGRLSVAAVRDVTDRLHGMDELRKAEERFRGAFDSAAIGMALVAPDGRWLQVNPALCELVGFSEEELLAGTFQSITHPEDLNTDLEYVRQMLAGEIDTYQMDKRYNHKLGRTIWIRLSVSLVRDRDGHPVHFVSQIEDMSQHKEAEELAEQLRHSQRLDAIGRLAGGVAHDFNNMLTAIKGYGDLLLESLDQGDARRSMAEQISRASEQASILPRQLLAFSRRYAWHPRLIDLNETLTAASDMLGRIVGDAVELVVLPRASSSCVLADPSYLEQVVLNLALNAGDAMPAGGVVRISTRNDYRFDEVTAGRGDPLREHVVIAVSDQGEGMDAETKARAFEPFFTTKPSGSGLGLATAYGIVSQSGGFIDIQSEQGRGSIVEVWLPCADVLSTPQDEPWTEPEGMDLGAGTVLLVEDEEIVRELAVTVLERGGYRVLAATTGDEALDLLQDDAREIDLLVTDVVMPGLGGRELAERASALRPDTRVLLISGYTDEAPPAGSGAASSQPPLLEKPFAPDTLLRRVGELIEQPPLPRARKAAPKTPAQITCLVADDHSAVLDAVTRYLGNKDIAVVASVSRGDEALEAILAHKPMVAVLDVRMQPLTGIEVARQASSAGSPTRCVLYTGYSDLILRKQAFDAGACGFLCKDAPLSELVQAVVAVAGGGTYVDAGLAGALDAGGASAFFPLTSREQQILAMVADGMTNEKAAAALGISPETIQSHVRNVMAKLDSDTRTQAVATAFRRSLLA